MEAVDDISRVSYCLSWMLRLALQLYQIPYDAIQAALELFTDEPSLEYRLWRVCASRIAVGILRKQMYFRVRVGRACNAG